MNLGEIMNTSNNESTSESIIANAAKGHSKQIEVNQKVNLKKKETIFILCDSCVWCATFFGKHMLPAENRCPYCLQTELSSFPILPNESFIFNYNEKRGIELKFNPRKKLPI
ncbi:MAG: hypothetical protein WCA39_06270 [Nitrososphaeraceae archaeon]|jgi:hypothetical protein